MKWKPVQASILPPQMKAWGATVQGHSLVITFDELHPELGHSFSVRNQLTIGGAARTVFVERGLKLFTDAERSARGWVRKHNEES